MTVVAVVEGPERGQLAAALELALERTGVTVEVQSKPDPARDLRARAAAGDPLPVFIPRQVGRQEGP